MAESSGLGTSLDIVIMKNIITEERSSVRDDAGFQCRNNREGQAIHTVVRAQKINQAKSSVNAPEHVDSHTTLSAAGL